MLTVNKADDFLLSQLTQRPLVLYCQILRETTGQKYRKGQREGKKFLARLAGGFIFLLANPEFYSHLASWRVGIRTPVYIMCFSVSQVCWWCWCMALWP
jgi:hypothetical protein